MNRFGPDVSARLAGPDWLVRRRAEAAEELLTMPLPTEKEEVWRYSPIDQLDLDAYRPVLAQEEQESDKARRAAGAVLDELGGNGALVVVQDGIPISWGASQLPDGVRLSGLASGDPLQPEHFGRVLTGGDALVRLNDAFHPDGVVLEVPRGVHLEHPIVIVHWCSPSEEDGFAPAAFPRTLIRLSEGSQASVVEVLMGDSTTGRALVVPVTELSVGEGANLAYVAVQQLSLAAWNVGRLVAEVERDATLRSFTLGLGGDYDRCRTDAAITGSGGSTEIKSAYFGSGDQIHDVRTKQDHAAPRTTSDLLCMGAVAERSRSVYTGLIRVRNGAARSVAMQTNRNLVLDEEAHADSVPNLDIEDNDVSCSHASSVGPIDEDQRYYIESRGVSPERAERLIVLGFFDHIIDQAPIPSVLDHLRRSVGSRLAADWRADG